MINMRLKFGDLREKKAGAPFPGSSLRVMLMVFLLAGILAGCTPKEALGFTIYLTKAQTVPSADLQGNLSKLKLEDNPVIGMDDITFYDRLTHQVSLTRAAARRIGELYIPVTGRTFLACLDGKPVYGGAFFTPLSSQSYDGVIILKPLSTAAPGFELSLGYPGPANFSGPDPRSNEALMKALEEAGKFNPPAPEGTP